MLYFYFEVSRDLQFWMSYLYHLFLCSQVTVWDLNRYGPNDFLGEVLLDLDNIVMNHEPNWYTLKPHEETASFSVSITLTFSPTKY